MRDATKLRTRKDKVISIHFCRILLFSAEFCRSKHDSRLALGLEAGVSLDRGEQSTTLQLPVAPMTHTNCNKLKQNCVDTTKLSSSSIITNLKVREENKYAIVLSCDVRVRTVSIVVAPLLWLLVDETQPDDLAMEAPATTDSRGPSCSTVSSYLPPWIHCLSKMM